MVNMMEEGHIVLLKQTILTLLPRPFHDEPTEPGRDVDGAHRGLMGRREGHAGPSFEQEEQVVDLFVHIQFGSFILSQALFAIFV